MSGFCYRNPSAVRAELQRTSQDPNLVGHVYDSSFLFVQAAAFLYPQSSLKKKKKGGWGEKKRTPCLNMPHLLPTWLKNKNSSC